MQPENRRFDHCGRELDLDPSSSEETTSSESIEEMSMHMKNKLYMMAMMGPGNAATTLSTEQQIKTALSTKFPEVSTNTASLTTMQQKKAPPLMSLRSDIGNLPTLTLDPVDQSVFKPSGTKGIQIATPNSKLVRLTASDYASAKATGLLTPQTSTKEFQPTTLQSMGLGELSLNNGKACGHDYKKKTEPRVLSPFNNKEVGTSPLSCVPCGGNETQQQRNRRQRVGLTSGMPLNGQKNIFSMDSLKVDRLTTQFAFIDKLGNKATQSLMKTGQAMNLACVPMPDYCSGTSIQSHLKCSHPEFYHLLEVNGLLNLLKQPDTPVMVVVPDREALASLPLQSDKAVADQLRYHIVKYGEGDDAKAFQKVTDVATYDTMLDGKRVQVERHEASDDKRPRNAYHTINGQLLRSDPVRQFIYAIYHIRGGLLLRPDDEMPVQQPEEEQEISPETPESKEEGQGEEKEVEGDGNAESEQEPQSDITSETETGTSAFMLRHVTHGTNTTFGKKGLASVVERMSQGYYSGRLSLSVCPLASVVQPERKTTDVCITLSSFNTDRLFVDYKANRLNELARVSSSHYFKMNFPADQKTQTHVKYDAQTHFTEYEYNTLVSPIPISHTKLSQGVLGISFNSPYDCTKHTVALCRLENPSSINNTDGTTSNVYMSQDENIIMRFTAGFLRTICINHHALANKNYGTKPLEKEHFIELATEKHDNALYYNILDKKAFDELLMTHGVAKKYIKKARRYAGKAASRGKREFDKASSSELQQVDTSVLDGTGFYTALESLDRESGGVSESLSIIQYGRSHKVRSSSRASQLALKKYEIRVGNESVLVYLPGDRENRIASDFGTTGLTKYVTLDLSDHPTMHINVSSMPSSKASRLFYVTAGGDLLVLKFSNDDSLTGLYAIPKRFDLAKRLIQARVK